MSTIKSYMKNKELKFKVSVGRSSRDGFSDPVDALRMGIELAKESELRVAGRVRDKSLSRQIGIVFGAEIAAKYFEGEES